jgi:hypothetical protein
MVHKPDDPEAGSSTMATTIEEVREGMDGHNHQRYHLESGPGNPEQDSDSSPPTPRFIQDETRYRRTKWVPMPIRRLSKRIVRWSKGPSPVQRQHIVPFFPTIQEAPIRLLDRYVKRKRAHLALVLFWYLCYGLTFGLVLQHSVDSAEIVDYGTPSSLGCGSSFWLKGNLCGLDGIDCRPFTNTALAFRCPASCAGYKVLNPRAVGTQEVIYAGIVVGGVPDPEQAWTDEVNSPVYRGDSFICQAAIHAGIIDNAAGGCGVALTTGFATNFTGSKANGIQSLDFDSHFPISYTFLADKSCSAPPDLRWALLGISIAFTTILSIFTSSPSVFFFSIFSALFIHVGFASDPPPHSSLADLFSVVISRYLPAMFVAYVIYLYVVRRTLNGLTAQVEKTVLWLGGAWTGALTNITFDFIPIQRLTPHDLNQQPGAKAALFFICLALVIIACAQIYYFRLEGRLRKYLAFYALLALGIIICVLLPGLNLRIHHYILALLLLPGTSMQTRPSLLYQGILLGLFINGICRWGFDSLLQTSAALQGDAQKGSPLPNIGMPLVNMNVAPEMVELGVMPNISFTFPAPPKKFDGVSVLVNDVERYRGYMFDQPVVENSEGVRRRANLTFVWERDRDVVVNEYFRFGWVSGTGVGDYTKAGVWSQDGYWVTMAPGPSKRRRRAIEGREEDRVTGVET